MPRPPDGYNEGTGHVPKNGIRKVQAMTPRWERGMYMAPVLKMGTRNVQYVYGLCPQDRYEEGTAPSLQDGYQEGTDYVPKMGTRNVYGPVPKIGTRNVYGPCSQDGYEECIRPPCSQDGYEKCIWPLSPRWVRGRYRPPCPQDGVTGT